jgi:two-component system chemotaxis response regulator CheY
MGHIAGKLAANNHKLPNLSGLVERKTSKGGSGMAPTVLIVDDAAFMRKMLRDMLADTDFEIIGEATSGAEAIAKYAALKPDLVLMDIMMPDVSGVAAVKEIVAADSQARIVICSVLRQQDMVMEALRAGARDFVVKPFSANKIREALQRTWAGGSPQGK